MPHLLFTMVDTQKTSFKEKKLFLKKEKFFSRLRIGLFAHLRPAADPNEPAQAVPAHVVRQGLRQRMGVGRDDRGDRGQCQFGRLKVYLHNPTYEEMSWGTTHKNRIDPIFSVRHHVQ
jgi:hypothetical protein